MTNWPEYDKALINKGFVTLWLDDNILAHWYFQGTHTRGGPLPYSDQCIDTALAIKAVFRPHGRPRGISTNTRTESEPISDYEEGYTNTQL